MPKALNSTSRSDSTSFNQKIQNLKRNQACHQCRKRKLKCDAKRPCSTCVRSHAYARAHASPNERVSIPEHPDCTFDDVSADPPSQPVPAAPKSRYERLESRINELESLLREKSATAESPSPSSANAQSTPSHTSEQSSLDFGHDFGTLPPLPASNSTQSTQNTIDSNDWARTYFPQTREDANMPMELHGFSGSFDHLAGITSIMQSSPPLEHGVTSMHMPSPSALIESRTSSSSRASNESLSMVYLSWPLNLPDITMTRHLVQAFFSHYIHAPRMWHAPTFVASLDLHPDDPKFPCSSVLYAMCAIGSLYASSAPWSAEGDYYQYDALYRARRYGKRKPVTFADQQAVFAREEAEAELASGERMFENVQTLVLLTWFYQSQSRWIEACLLNGMSIRSTIPCALNVCPPFHGITSSDAFSDRPPTLLPNAKSVREDEARRNTFWAAYVMERQLGASTSWAMLLDDKDVAQLLPLREDQFYQGLLVLPLDRQWSHAKDVFEIHPPDQTDSFIMHVKCSMLFSKVKGFNIRFKSLAYAGDPSVTPVVDTLPAGDNTIKKFSPKAAPLFLELDNLIMNLKSGFPLSLRNPINDGKIDQYLYSAWNLLHLTQIHLHEPYAKPGNQSCMSAFKILTASRGIVDLLHSISSSSFDVSLLDIYPFLAWFVAGRVLVRFLKAAQDAQAQDQILSLRTEVVFLRTKLIQAGVRIPLAATYARMLDNTFVSTCGEGDETMANQDSGYGSQVDVTSHTARYFSFKNSTEPQPMGSEMTIMSVNGVLPN